MIGGLKPEIHHRKSVLAVEGEQLRRRVRQFALFDAESEVIPHSDISSGLLVTESPETPEDLQPDLDRIDGPVLFAGLVPDQFGHVLLNSLGRLWALETLPRETRLLFHSRYRPRLSHYPFLIPILNALGVHNEVVVRRGSYRLEEVYTASDLFGERHGGDGAPEYYDWIDRRNPPKGPVDPNLAVYVTRGSLGPTVGRFACEHILEAELREEGYQIFAPERHALSEQIDVFQRAGRIIFAEGSALHLYAMLRRPEQRAAVILRRRSLPDLMICQIASREGAPVQVIDVIEDVLWPPVRPDHRSISFLDFARLQSELHDMGFVRNRRWRLPTEEEINSSMLDGLAPGERLLNQEERRQFLRQLRQARNAGARV